MTPRRSGCRSALVTLLSRSNATPDEPLVVIATPRLVLSLPSAAAAARYLAYFDDNRAHLEPWEPTREAGFYTPAFWRARIEKNRREYVTDQSMRLALTLGTDPDGPVVGQVNFNNFVRGAFQAATLGYSLDHRHVGQGYMHEALRWSIPWVVRRLGMHRIMANYIPTNERSGRLLRRLGFVVEGYARDYLRISGTWRDHVLTALTAPVPWEGELEREPL